MNRTVEEIIRQEKAKKTKFYFEPLSGNNGDVLIEMGSRELFKRIGIVLEKKPNEADTIIINGSGGMTSHWGAFETVIKYLNEYKDKTVIVLPSSWELNVADFNKIDTIRHKPCYFFAREKYSYDKLNNLIDEQKSKLNFDVFCFIGHDMAFQLKDSEYMSKLKSRNLSKNILVIERTDKESPTTISKDNNERFKLLKNSIKKIIPRKYYKKLIWSFIILLRPVKKRKMQKIWGSSDFSRWAVSEVVRRNPILRDTDVKFLDVSNHKVVSFKEFEEEMISASAIVTTRLHGAILGAMLGKDTYFVKGVWHKYIGVYEHSLKEYSNVNLIEYK